MQISKELLKFAEDHRGTYNFALTSDLLLQKDLKIYGDDATDFMTAFFKEFNVDSNGFDLDEYFEGDGGLNFFTLKSSTKKQISLGDLQRFIDQGKFCPDNF